MWAKDLVVSSMHIEQFSHRYEVILTLSNGQKTFKTNLTDLEADLELFHIRTFFNILDTFDSIKHQIMLQAFEIISSDHMSVPCKAFKRCMHIEDTNKPVEILSIG